MKTQLVYDLPMRIFHWLFAGLFVAVFLVAKTSDDESIIFSYHMLAGLLLVFTVLLRVLWGFVGTKYSRFTSFALHPKDLVAYFSEIFSGQKRKWSGHNPASSWATIAMFGLALGLGITGFLMASGNKEAFEDLHELLANGFLVVVLMHIAGVILHAFRHQDGIGMTMIHGAKNGLPAGDVILKSRSGIALLFVGLVVLFAIHLGHNFDIQKRTLNFFGTTLQLGESEGDEGSEQSEAHSENDSEHENEDGAD
jgi:cytochrome b